MRRSVRLIAVATIVLGLAGVAGAATVKLRPVKVTVVGPAGATSDRTANIQIAFAPQQLPGGGYYYAVVVLGPYTYYSMSHTPSCAVSSNMRATQYGFPRRGATLRLTLTRAPATVDAWCAGATYRGAVYAVPHRPSCSGYYRCSGGTAQCNPFCGVVAQPQQHYPGYPGGLPKPIDRSTRIVGRFTVTYASG